MRWNAWKPLNVSIVRADRGRQWAVVSCQLPVGSRPVGRGFRRDTCHGPKGQQKQAGKPAIGVSRTVEQLTPKKPAIFCPLPLTRRPLQRLKRFQIFCSRPTAGRPEGPEDRSGYVQKLSTVLRSAKRHDVWAFGDHGYGRVATRCDALEHCGAHGVNGLNAGESVLCRIQAGAVQLERADCHRF